MTACDNIPPAVKLRAGVFNITDEKYLWWPDARGFAVTAANRDAYTQPGRNLSVSLITRF